MRKYNREDDSSDSDCPNENLLASFFVRCHFGALGHHKGETGLIASHSVRPLLINTCSNDSVTQRMGAHKLRTEPTEKAAEYRKGGDTLRYKCGLRALRNGAQAKKPPTFRALHGTSARGSTATFL